MTLLIFFNLFRDKGVKVELGIPEDLWDKPSAEVTHLKMQVSSIYYMPMYY